MEKLEIIEAEKDQIWDDIIKSFYKWQVYYLNEYVNSQKINDQGKPLLVYYTNDHGRLAVVTMKRRIDGGYFDLTTPYGYGGPLIDSDGENLIGSFNRVFQKYCLDNYIVSEFIRFSPFLNNHISMEDYCEVVLAGNMTTIDLKSYEQMWSNMKQGCRNRIRKAQREGIEIRNDCRMESLKQFKEIYNEAMNRNHAADYYYFKDEFYESLYSKMKDYMQFFYAVYEENIISSYMIFYNENGAHCHLGGTKSDFIRLSPANLIIFEAAKWCIERNIPFLHLGGGVGLKDDNLLRFKKTFNKEGLREYYIGKKIFNSDQYKELVDLRIKKDNQFDKNTLFFPAYRS